MKHGVILESAVPVRAEPSDRSEMVNQLIFGEQYDLLEENEKWIKISSDHDRYEGWIDLKQHTSAPKKAEKFQVNPENVFISHFSRGQVLLPAGCLIPEEAFLKSNGFSVLNQKISTATIKEAGWKFINAPYLWGGRTSLGIDCSGFTQLVFRMLGVDLPRDASQQVNEGELVSFINETVEGDLAFFDNAEGKITHVGIIIGKENKTIIHASGRVREDKIDHNGIYNEETNSYSHKLRTIKTIL